MLPPEKGVRIDQITSVAMGWQNSTFGESKEKPENPRCCFTIYTQDRSYDFETQSPEDTVDCVFFLRRMKIVAGMSEMADAICSRVRVYLANVGLQLPELAQEAGFGEEGTKEYLRYIYEKSKSATTASQRFTPSMLDGFLSPVVSQRDTSHTGQLNGSDTKVGSPARLL
eukprot:gb/GECG01000183.1/.p1 GENE.gb/GECG01000183.1/~~gb/GECG01000183.1/.p1  ORF type:complete len:170 (+),score=23.31 gb/GECG01000183.1/:1-510(+)